jgi:alkyl hydroperoxide reductase subunit AhpC
MKRWIWMTMAVMAAAVVAARAEVKTGEAAPDFTLKSVEGQDVKLSDYKGKYVVLEWINHGCPFVVKHYDSGNMPALQKELTGKDVVWLSVCSSAENKQGYETPEGWKKLNEEKKGAASAILLDTEGTVGKAYGAKTTPHMYVVNPEGTLIYQGAIDDKPSTDQEDIPGAKNYVKAAIEEDMAGKPVTTASTKPYGCGVKYK